MLYAVDCVRHVNRAVPRSCAYILISDPLLPLVYQSADLDPDDHV